jgi:hypothetical protein
MPARLAGAPFNTSPGFDFPRIPKLLVILDCGNKRNATPLWLGAERPRRAGTCTLTDRFFRQSSTRWFQLNLSPGERKLPAPRGAIPRWPGQRHAGPGSPLSLRERAGVRGNLSPRSPPVGPFQEPSNSASPPAEPEGYRVSRSAVAAWVCALAQADKNVDAPIRRTISCTRRCRFHRFVKDWGVAQLIADSVGESFGIRYPAREQNALALVVNDHKQKGMVRMKVGSRWTSAAAD